MAVSLGVGCWVSDGDCDWLGVDTALMDCETLGVDEALGDTVALGEPDGLSVALWLGECDWDAEPDTDGVDDGLREAD